MSGDSIFYWRGFDEENDSYFEYFSDPEDIARGSMFPARKDKDLICISLFELPEGKWGTFAMRLFELEELFVNYFDETFKPYAFTEGARISGLYEKLVIPSSTYHDILNLLNDNELLHLRHLILVLISLTQDLVCVDIKHLESLEYKKATQTAFKEAKMLINVLELSGLDYKDFIRQKGEPQLLKISFTFKSEKITIKNQHVMRDILYNTWHHYNSLTKGDWKKGVLNIASRSNLEASNLSFKNNLIKSYYSLFKGEELFNFQKPYPNRPLAVIAQLLEYSLIQIGHSHYSDNEKGKLIRGILNPPKQK